MDPPQRLNLLDLPVDVLTLILRPLVTSAEAVVPVCPCERAPLNPLPVLLAHPALHAIACSLFYGENVFELDMTGKHGKHVRLCIESAEAAEAQRARPVQQQGRDMPRRDEEDMARFSGEQSLPHHLILLPWALRRIHTLRVRLDRLRGWVHTAITPRLQDMAVRGALAHLSLSVCSTGPSSGPSVSITSSAPADAGIFGRPPMSGLLAVLADPYLRTARLWVSPVHGPAWCEFHAGKSCALTPATGTTARRRRTAAAGAGVGAGVSGTSSGAHGHHDDDDDDDVAGAVSDREDRHAHPRAEARAEGRGLLEVDWRRIVRAVDPEGRGVAVAWQEDLAARRWL